MIDDGEILWENYWTVLTWKRRREWYHNINNYFNSVTIEPQNFNTMWWRNRHWTQSWATSVQLTLPLPIFLKSFLSSSSIPGIQNVSAQKLRMNLFPLPELHAQPIVDLYYSSNTVYITEVLIH